MASEGFPGQLHWGSVEHRRETDIFFAMTKNRTPQNKKRKARAAHQCCTFCGKEDQENLRNCSLCKSARYCNKQCQLADYKARHKQECVDFVHPPLTRAFMTEPINDEQYAQRPVFARGHRQGVGCWVSVDGEFDASLKPLAEPMDLTTTEDYHATMARRMALAPGPQVLLIGEKSKAFTRNLLTLSILVQNRRKDNMKVLVFGSRVQLVSLASTKEAFEKGRPEVDNFHTFQSGGDAMAVMSVADDPWEKRPRLRIKNLSGTDIRDSAPLHPSIHDASKGIVSLDPGEYVIYRTQFRVGDDDRIATDFEALGRLCGLSVAFTLWEQGSDPLLLDYMLSQHIHNDGHAPQGIHAIMDPPALYEFYADYIERGEEAFVESHFGKERVEALRRQAERMERMGTRRMETIERTGEIDMLIAGLRDIGLQDAADKFESKRTRAA